MASNIKYLLIDSKDRDNYTNTESHDISVVIKPAVNPPKRICLKALSIPMTNYYINSTNNTIYFNSSSTSLSAQLNPGAYDYLTLGTEIKRVMEATAYSGTITVTYDTDDFLFTIAGTVAYYFEWDLFDTNTFAPVLGYPNVSTAPAATSHTALYPSVLAIPQYFYIDIDQFNHMLQSTDNSNHTFPIFITALKGDILLHFENNNYNIDNIHGNHPIHKLDIKLQSRDNVAYNINNSDWSMLLELEY